MEDRYLFKAKRADNGEWVTGYYTKSIVNGSVFGYIRESIFGTDIKIMLNTLCQYTGLKDKNGKLIWEGDIILFQLDNDDCPFPNKDTKKRLGKVFYKGFRTTFAIGMGENGSSSINDDLWKYVQNGNRVEVIGNVFDNAELLENEGQHGRKEL